MVKNPDAQRDEMIFPRSHKLVVSESMWGLKALDFCKMAFQPYCSTFIYMTNVLFFLCCLELQNTCRILFILTFDLNFCENKDTVIYSYAYHPKSSIKDVFISTYIRKPINIAF